MVSVLSFNMLTGCARAEKTESIIKKEKPVRESKQEQLMGNYYVSNYPMFDNLIGMFMISNRSKEEIINTESKDSILYFSALYIHLRDCGLNDDEIITYLHNMSVAGIVNIGSDTLERLNLLYGKLYDTLGEGVNVLEFYYPLAKYVHVSECSLGHTKDEDGITYCDGLLDELYGEYNNGVLFAEAFMREVYSSGDEELINELNSIVCHDVDVIKCFEQLETMYLMIQIPRCVDECEWIADFYELLKTTTEYENVCEKYRKLAIFRHFLVCDQEHYVNEFGNYECDAHSLRLTN